MMPVRRLSPPSAPKFLLPCMAALLLMAAVLALPRAARAYICTNCACIAADYQNMKGQIAGRHDIMRETVFGRHNPVPTSTPNKPSGTGRLGVHQSWEILYFFQHHILPAFMMMTEQLVATSMEQMFIIGAYFDASQTLSTQRLLQELTAEAHKDYQPSVEMCVVATAAKSLAISGRNAELTQNVLSEQYLARMLNSKGASSTLGPESDKKSMKAGDDYNGGRFQIFMKRFCDNDDYNPVNDNKNDTGFFFCKSNRNAKGLRANADIDFAQTVMTPRTIDVDFIKAAAPPDSNKTEKGAPAVNQDLLMMASNLYGHDVLISPAADTLAQTSSYNALMAIRSAVAKRSVAQNSFDAIVSLKTRGSAEDMGYPGDSENNHAYLVLLMEQLGMSKDDAVKYIGTQFGDKTPSYFAQMEILSKKLYQRPEFYSGLYDKPANVRRRAVAMQAVGLMLDRDIYDSYLRSEALLSLILEARLAPLQEKVQSDIARIQ